MCWAIGHELFHHLDIEIAFLKPAVGIREMQPAGYEPNRHALRHGLATTRHRAPLLRIGNPPQEIREVLRRFRDADARGVHLAWPREEHGRVTAPMIPDRDPGIKQG